MGQSAVMGIGFAVVDSVYCRGGTKVTGKRVADGQTSRIKSLVAEYDSAKRELEISYGKNREVRSAIAEIDARMQQTIQERTAHTRKPRSVELVLLRERLCCCC